MKISDEDLNNIGDLLGYKEQYAKKYARRFILGVENNLKNWYYGETINYGDMHKV